MVCEWWIIYESFDSIKGYSESTKRAFIYMCLCIQDVIKAYGSV